MKNKLQIKREIEIEGKLKKYCEKYGFSAYIDLLISTHALIRGGWSYNNAKEDLRTNIQYLSKQNERRKKMNIYTDGKRHRNRTFRTRQERDEEVEELRENGWKVKVGKYGDIDGSGEIYYYEATK